jgi:hypothetical protein
VPPSTKRQRHATVPGIDNCVQTQWLVFVNPLAVKLLGTQYVPVLDRDCDR